MRGERLNPTISFLHKSFIPARYSQSSRVGIYVISLTQTRLQQVFCIKFCERRFGATGKICLESVVRTNLRLRLSISSCSRRISLTFHKDSSWPSASNSLWSRPVGATGPLMGGFDHCYHAFCAYSADGTLVPPYDSKIGVHRCAPQTSFCIGH